MVQRVLSTDQARIAISQMQSILSGGLETSISQLNQQGTVLSDPNVWDGPLASEFRSNVWPGTSKALNEVKARLDELQTKLQQINQNIMAAGGNA
jgi:hypothetical protein